MEQENQNGMEAENENTTNIVQDDVKQNGKPVDQTEQASDPANDQQDSQDQPSNEDQNVDEDTIMADLEELPELGGFVVLSDDTEETNGQDGRKRARLSGAEVRKRRKEEKIAKGTWTAEKPNKGDETEERGRTQDRSKDHTRKQSTDSKYRHNSNERGREHKYEGKFARDRARRYSKDRNPYKKIQKPITMAIINKSYPEEFLEESQVTIIKEKILAALDETPSGTEAVPQFDGSRFGDGIFWLTCSNTATKDWLIEKVKTFENLWENAGELTVLEGKELPKRFKVIAKMSQAVEGDIVKKRLEMQNPGLKATTWKTLDRKVDEKGQAITFFIDEESLTFLQRCHHRVYLGLGCITFDIIRNSQQ